MKKFVYLTHILVLAIVPSCLSPRNTNSDGIADGTGIVDFDLLHIQKVSSSPYITWTQFGPGNSGYCEIVEYHPVDPECVMMSPDMANTYGSWDNGFTWKTVKDHDGIGGDLVRMRDYSFSATNPDFGAGLDFRAELWLTYDRGRSWQKGNFRENLCSVVEICPHNENVMLIGGGNFWLVKNNHRTYRNPHHANFTRADYGKLWRSDDRGKTWKLSNTGIDKNADFAKIKFHPAIPGIVYAATSHGLYKSFDYGHTWNNIGNELSRNMIRDMDLHYDHETGSLQIIVIDQVFWEPDGMGGTVSSGGVYRTSDEGTSWVSLNSNLYLDISQMSEPVQEGYYSSIARWFGISRNAARRDYPVLPSAVLQNFNRLVINPSNPDIIYLGHSARHDISFYAGDLWKTENGGESWISAARIGLAWEGVDREYWESRGNPVNQNMNFAHLRYDVGEYYYARTGCRALTINSRGDVIAVFEQQTFQSTDDGNTWQQIDDIETYPGSDEWVGTGSSNLPGRPFIMDPRLEGKYYIMSGEHGLFQIVEQDSEILKGVPSVRQITGQVEQDKGPHSIFYNDYDKPGAASPSAVALHPDDPDIIYMLMFRPNHAGHVRRSLDRGKTWENISRPLDINERSTAARRRIFQHSFIINRDNPDKMYFCVPSWILNDVNGGGMHRITTRRFGVYASTDGGYKWERKNKGLPGDFGVNFMSFDPSDHSILYAAVQESYDKSTKGGLYISKDDAGSWEPLGIPTVIRSVNHVHINPVSGSIYIACGLPGGRLEEGGVWVSHDKGQSWEHIFKMQVAFSVTTAPYDHERIAISTGVARRNPVKGGNNENDRLYFADDMDNPSFNPGAYVSLNFGKTWHKANKGLGQPDRVADLQFDLTDPTIMWCSLMGSGWYKGELTFPKH